MRGRYALTLAMTLLLATMAAAQAPPSAAQLLTGIADVPAPVDSATPLEATWTQGLRLRSENRDYDLHVGGNAQIDSTWLIGPNSAFASPGGGANGIDNSSATFLRRVRIRFDGRIHRQFDYMIEYDLANAANENNGQQPASFNSITGSPVPTNVWLQVRDVPWFGTVRIGNQTKPIGFTAQVSQVNLPFLERPDNHDAFYGPFDNGNAVGITARDHSDDQRRTWQYGIYRPLTNSFGFGVSKFEWGGRITGLPLDEDDGGRLIHLGFGTLNGELPQDQLRLRARPLLRNGPGFAVPIIVDTGEVDGHLQYTLAPEFAAVYGPWSVEAEWTGQFLTQAAIPGGPRTGIAFFHGAYAQTLLFLTGETQPYDRDAAAFGRVIPNSNFQCTRSGGISGTGAWQVGARISYLHLNNGTVQGGTVYDLTLGLNWYLNPNMRCQFNYILEHRNQPGVGPQWFNGLGLRGGYDF